MLRPFKYLLQITINEKLQNCGMSLDDFESLAWIVHYSYINWKQERNQNVGFDQLDKLADVCLLLVEAIPRYIFNCFVSLR